MSQSQLAHLASADDQDRLIIQMVEYLLDIIDGSAGDGNMAACDAGLGADAASHSAGMTKQGVQQRANAVVADGLFVSSFDLTGNLPFADDHTVETGSDAEQVAYGFGLAMNVQMGAHIRDR